MKSAIRELTHIVQAVSHASSLDDQIELIVQSISKAMAVDVCSLYMANRQAEMLLLASHGLAASAVRKVKLPPGKGLIGLVASTRQPVNIADAGRHPAYFYIAEAKEEPYHGFCAVPLVERGKVVGVLAVERSAKRRFSRDEEGFLVTLAAQLALLLANAPLPIDGADTHGPVRGTSGVPGLAIGSSHLCDAGGLYDVPDEPCQNVASTMAEWRALLESFRREIAEEGRTLGNLFGDAVQGIFKAYEMLSADPAFIEDVERRIAAGSSLPSALRQTTEHLSALFITLSDPYLQARHEDIHHLGNKLYSIWRGAKTATHSTKTDVVLVGHQVSVSDIASVANGELRGIVCFDGSRLSHSAVLANALGVPAVMGIGVLAGIEEGQRVVVDGHHAHVWIDPSETVLAQYRDLIEKNRLLRIQLEGLRDEPARTLDDERVNLYANTGLLTDISPGLKSGAQGVGLYRTEIPFMLRDSFPSEEEQVRVYRRVLEAYRGKPVYMRTLDIGADKQLPYFQMGDEENPALGWRGIRFTLDNSPVLLTQVRAMLKAARGLRNLHILLPMVTSVCEIDDFHALLSDALRQLLTEGIAAERPPVGIMLEVPAAISQIPLFRGKVDFISIGSNDLSQYLLAADRNNARMAARYDDIHPAVLREIARILAGARTAGIPVSLCGEMASEPVAVVLLLGMGLRDLSMSAARLPLIKGLIRKISIEQARTVTEQALALHDARAIRSLVEALLAPIDLPMAFLEPPLSQETTR